MADGKVIEFRPRTQGRARQLETVRQGALPGESGKPEADWLPAPRPSKGKRSFAFQRAVREARGLSCTEKVVLFILATYARHRGAQGRCWPSVATIQRGCGLKSRRTVMVALRSLATKGWITERRRWSEAGQVSHEFTLHAPGS